MVKVLDEVSLSVVSGDFTATLVNLGSGKEHFAGYYWLVDASLVRR